MSHQLTQIMLNLLDTIPRGRSINSGQPLKLTPEPRNLIAKLPKLLFISCGQPSYTSKKVTHNTLPTRTKMNPRLSNYSFAFFIITPAGLKMKLLTSQNEFVSKTSKKNWPMVRPPKAKVRNNRIRKQIPPIQITNTLIKPNLNQF
ncbi:hypothetical protein ACOSQ4_018616 [Xanthoceras sorbifolium]